MKLFIETPVTFLVPDTLAEAREQYRNRLISAKELTEKQDEAVAQLIEQQLAAHMPQITQGALRRTNGVRDFWLRLNGITETLVLTGNVLQDQNSGEVIPRVTGKIEANVNNQLYNHFSFLQDRAGKDSVVRMDLPAPALFLLDAVRNKWIDADLYQDNVEALIADIAKAYNDTIRHLYDQGCRRVLLIDRSWQRLCDANAAKRLLLGGINIDEFMLQMRRVNDEALDDLPKDMYVILDVPVNVPLSEKCTDVVSVLFGHKNVNAFMFAYPQSHPEAVDLIKFFPADKELILGVVDPKYPQLEEEAVIRARIDEALSRLPYATTLGITTMGGFRGDPNVYQTSAFTPEDQWHKIELLQQLA